MPRKKAKADKNGDEDSWPKVFERLISKVYKAETTTTGRVNSIGILGVAIWGIVNRSFFTNSDWVVVPVAFIISAIVADSFRGDKQN